MGNNKLVLSGIVGAIAYFVLGMLFYGMLLHNFFESNAGSATGVNREMPVFWVLFIGNLGFSFLLATVFSWSNINTAAAGAKSGAIIGFLTGVGYDFIMYATTHMMKKWAVVADVATITIMSLIVGAIVASILGKGKQQA